MLGIMNSFLPTVQLIWGMACRRTYIVFPHCGIAQSATNDNFLAAHAAKLKYGRFDGQKIIVPPQYQFRFLSAWGCLKRGDIIAVIK